MRKLEHTEIKCGPKLKCTLHCLEIYTGSALYLLFACVPLKKWQDNYGKVR